MQRVPCQSFPFSDRAVLLLLLPVLLLLPLPRALRPHFIGHDPKCLHKKNAPIYGKIA